jgi:hypothetical protein
MLKIKITWNGVIYDAKVISDYKVEILDTDINQTIELDQCKHCGVWLSEEEGCYGDGYCDGCAAMCIHCELYHNAADMIPPEKDGEEYVCKECDSKLPE